MMRRELRLIAFDRPEMLRQCLAHLFACRGWEDWKIVASVDGLPGGGHQSEVVQILRGVPQLDVRLRSRFEAGHYGKRIAAHVRENWSECVREGAETLLHLEDDMLLAPDALEWCLAQEPKLWPPGGIASLILLGAHARDGHPRPETLEVARILRYEWTLVNGFCCYGAYMTRQHVERMLEAWKDEWEHFDAGMVDIYKERCWWAQMPLVSRLRNIGYELGSVLEQEVRRPVWSGMCCDYRGYAPPP